MPRKQLCFWDMFLLLFVPIFVAEGIWWLIAVQMMGINYLTANQSEQLCLWMFFSGAACSIGLLAYRLLGQKIAWQFLIWWRVRQMIACKNSTSLAKIKT
jgi:hypothetical protein